VSLLDLLGLSGLTLILTRGTIFRGVRRLWPHLLGCPQCVGWHVGFWGSIGSAVLAWHAGIAIVHVVVQAIVFGGAVSLGSSLSDGVLERFFGPSLDVDNDDTPPDGLIAAARRRSHGERT